MANLKFFIDFDGTITQTDVVDMILERFAPEAWKAVEKEWTAGKIGSRECLSRQMALVRATKNEFKEFLKDVEIDGGFVDFMARLKELSIPAFIVSDGFDVVIEEVLKRAFQNKTKFLLGLPIFCNRLEFVSGGLEISFPAAGCAHACANCKPGVIASLTEKEDRIIFVGDGLSDRFAAQVSYLTFAKNKLLFFCEENKKIRFLSYSSFTDIHNWLNDYLSAGDAEGESSIFFKGNPLKKIESRRRQDPLTKSF